jgi:L-lactate dehydrogenase complex protein LldF
MSGSAGSIPFRANAAQAVRNPLLRGAMRNATETFTKKRTDSLESVPIEKWREAASTLRLKIIDHLDELVDRFSKNAVRAGAQVHPAQDSAGARETIAGILKDYGIRRVVKSKSMVSEEIHLNSHLEKEGIVVVETDLGEYIIQIAGEGPSHIIVPAIHKDRRQIGRLFADKIGCEYSEDPVFLTSVARKILRQEFLAAKAGISGANFLVADSGSLVMVTNEGNGRMCTSLPPLHIAVVSIEKIIPSLADLPTFMRLLPRSATGQIITTYTSVITGTRKPHEATGAQELHIVLVDNGRWEIAKGEYREMLKCIRCGACLNACPVYRAVGGHAYGATYPGPMGIVLTTLLNGMDNAHPLLDATTLCGACADVCPVKVPLPHLLRRLREQRVELGLTPTMEQAGMAGFGLAVQSPGLFRAGQAAARLMWPAAKKVCGGEALDRLPSPVWKTFGRRVR